MTVEASDWNLISGGPSRAKLRDEHFLEGPRVTVNRAIDIAGRGLRVDFAAIADGPGGAWEKENLERFWRPGMVLWVSTRPLTETYAVTNEKGEVEHKDRIGRPLSKLWDHKLMASIGFRYMPWGYVKDVDDETQQRHAFTTLQAFLGIMRYRPSRIRILCMDLSGPWMPGKTEEECAAIDMEKRKLSRWRHERFNMDIAIKSAREKGVEVEEMTPE